MFHQILFLVLVKGGGLAIIHGVRVGLGSTSQLQHVDIFGRTLFSSWPVYCCRWALYIGFSGSDSATEQMQSFRIFLALQSRIIVIPFVNGSLKFCCCH